MGSLTRSGPCDVRADDGSRKGAASHRVWWLGYWPTADGIRWWLTYRLLGPDGSGPVAEPVHGSVGADRLSGPMRRLEAALVRTMPEDPPDEMAGPDRVNAVHRAWRGALATPADEFDLAAGLGQLLLPPALVDELCAGIDKDPNPQPSETVVIAPGPTLSQVPFELLVVDPGSGLRLLEVARVRAGLSAAAGVGAVVPARTPATGVLRVIDPGPSARAAAARGGVYAHGVPAPIYRDHGIDERWFSRDDGRGQLLNAAESFEPVTKDVLAQALQRLPERMLFLGHALSGLPQAPASAGLVLADPADGGPFRPFTAAQWIRDPTRWPAPPLVALMSCHSNDTHLFEQMGLVQAAVHAGARLVTSTRWVLPADHTAGNGAATTDLALAVDAAHDSADPVSTLRQWQLGRLDAWRRDPGPASAPLIWAAPVSYQRAPLDHRGAR